MADRTDEDDTDNLTMMVAMMMAMMMAMTAMMMMTMMMTAIMMMMMMKKTCESIRMLSFSLIINRDSSEMSRSRSLRNV